MTIFRRSTTSQSVSSSRLLLRRKMTVASVVVATFLFLLFYNLGSYFFIKKMGGYLEQSLNARLRTAANLAIQLVERDLYDVYNTTDHPLIRIVLTRIKNENDLEAAYIIDAHYNVLLDSRLDLEFATNRSYVIEDSTAISAALNGTIITSRLHTIAGNHFKSVYSPLTDLSGNMAILVLEASANYFDVIRFFRRGLWLGAITSALLLTLLTLFLIGATTLFLRTEEQLQTSRRLASMGQMAATVAHEIRNPLGIIKSTTDVLREKYQPHDRPDELFGFINDEVQRLNRLVNDFLTLSREPELHLQKVNLVEVVEEAIRKHESNREVTCDIRFAPEVTELSVLCDKDKIYQVLLNLLINATQAVDGKEDGAILVNVAEEKARGKKYARVEVADNGGGIDGNVEEIFEPFYTTKTRGTGLGLAVSRTIIELHGGRIEAKNRSEGGTIITFYLPLKK